MLYLSIESVRRRTIQEDTAKFGHGLIAKRYNRFKLIVGALDTVEPDNYRRSYSR